MVSPGTHFIKIMSPSLEPLRAEVKKTMNPKLKMLWPLCNQTINLKTDSRTLYYSIVKLKYSPSIYFKVQQRLKEICIVKQKP